MNSAGAEVRSVNGSRQRPDASERLFLQVGELIRHLGQLAVQSDLRHGVFVDLDPLIDDHLRPLDARQNRAEEGVGGSRGEHGQHRNQE